MGAKEYRFKTRVQAEQIEESGNVVTSDGPRVAFAGDYLVWAQGGTVTYLMIAEEFNAVYEEIPGDAEYSPVGKTVDQVIEFMQDNPDQVDRIKAAEQSGGKRKGIINYEV